MVAAAAVVMTIAVVMAVMRVMSRIAAAVEGVRRVGSGGDVCDVREHFTAHRRVVAGLAAGGVVCVERFAIAEHAEGEARELGARADIADRRRDLVGRVVQLAAVGPAQLLEQRGAVGTERAALTKVSPHGDLLLGDRCDHSMWHDGDGYAAFVIGQRVPRASSA